MNKALFLLPILSLLANGLQAATNSISAEPPATTVSLYDDVLINATNVGAGTWTTKRATVATVLAAAPPPANITSNQLNAGTWQQATQQMVGYTLYSSSLGCAGNSDMVAGGGSDDYAKLQAALNLATTKPVHLIIEKPTLISTGLVCA